MNYIQEKRDQIFKIIMNIGEGDNRLVPSKMMTVFLRIDALLEEIYEQGKKDLAKELLANEEQLSKLLNQKIKNHEKKNNRSK